MLYGWKREAQTGVLPGERVMGAIRAGVRYVRYAPILRAVLIRTAAFTIGGFDPEIESQLASAMRDSSSGTAAEPAAVAARFTGL